MLTISGKGIFIMCTKKLCQGSKQLLLNNKTNLAEQFLEG